MGANAKLFKSTNSESLWLNIAARRHLDSTGEEVAVDIVPRTPELVALHIRPGTALKMSNGYISFARIRTSLSILIGHPNLCLGIKAVETDNPGEVVVVMEVSLGHFTRKRNVRADGTR